jgi:hypothetical protein
VAARTPYRVSARQTGDRSGRASGDRWCAYIRPSDDAGRCFPGAALQYDRRKGETANAIRAESRGDLAATSSVRYINRKKDGE